MEFIKYDINFFIAIRDICDVRIQLNNDGTKRISNKAIHFVFDNGGITMYCENNTFRIACSGSHYRIVKCAYKTQLDGVMISSFLDNYIEHQNDAKCHYIRFLYCKEDNQSGFFLDNIVKI